VWRIASAKRAFVVKKYKYFDFYWKMADGFSRKDHYSSAGIVQRSLKLQFGLYGEKS